MIKAAVIGGDDPRAGELIRLLLNHPDVELISIYAPALAGRKISDRYPDLAGETDLCFVSDADFDTLDVIFNCLPDGALSRIVDIDSLPDDLRIIDLSADRLDPATDSDFVYGVPELNRKPMVRGAHRVAVPGSVAMASLLALLPLAKNLLLNSPVAITSVSGSAETGRVSVSLDSDAAEISTALRGLYSSFNAPLSVLKVAGPSYRGTLVAVVLATSLSVDSLRGLYDDYYSDHNFTFVVDRPVDPSDVAGTNKCLIHFEKTGDRMLVTAVIDNLLKGSAGNAVHCMNLLFGLHERVGLMLKASVG